ncbi:ATP/maltotriose-dependent transcriptional regulator MalT [Microterricola gilva]|uniref:ATP/maltotriose-dependent transcriptional regulator MalT n=1 Tax=Microterricola gilva TaxID=393267 RepID=A0A4Q8ARD5_9MICO|nr:LuxR C-terminal-related transcriptional regulator [Microterricola gilva]RZU66703.1 ATP/maltotriose-dependent transcriptional regulator MalT [Microterricola gilva]
MGLYDDTLAKRDLASGLIPPPAVCYVSRPRLDVALDALIDGTRSIVCVWGAPGSGKTTLLASWARTLNEAGHRTSWLSARETPRAPMNIQPLLDPTIADGDDLGFVFIDDVHLLTASERLILFRALESLPARARVVISGRYQPFASLAFLEATGLLCELRTADLAFDECETTRLAARHGITLSEGAVRSVAERTAGWITALALAMPWIRGSSDPEQAIAQFGANHRAVADYLVTEVLLGMDDGDRAVLMAAAVRECIPLELLSVLSGRADAGEVMLALARRNALITEDGGDFRIHPVLLGFMQAEARRHNLELAQRHHAMAAAWYVAHHDGPAAFEQALASADPDTTSAVLDQFGLELALSGTDAFSRAEWRTCQPTESLAMLVIQLLMRAPYSADSRQSRHLVARANQQAGADGVSQDWTLALLAVNCFSSAPDGVVRERLRSLATPSARLLREQSLALDLLAATAEGWCQDRLGNPAGAALLYRQVADAAHSMGYSWLYLLVTDLAVASLAACNEWTQAFALEDQLAQSAQAVMFSQNSRAVAGATVLLEGRRYQRCEPLDIELLDGVIAADPLGADFGLLVPARLLRELPALDSGVQLRAVADRVERISRESGHRFPRLLGAACVRLASARLTLDGREMARDVVDFTQSVLGGDSLEVMTARYVLSPPTQSGESVERRLEDALHGQAKAWHSGAAIAAWIVLAQTAQNTGREAEADARVMRAVRLAEHFQAPRPFLARNGEGVALVEARLGRFGSLERMAEHIVNCGTAALPVGVDELRLIESLTSRERSILRELPVHQSVAEIARKQTLSVNTVKTHLRNIYLKLSVSGRSEAVRVAQERELL